MKPTILPGHVQFAFADVTTLKRYALKVRPNRSATNAPPHRPIGIIRQRYPQPTLIRSLLDRRLMGYADRGGSSGYVGDSWGGFCAAWLASHVGQRIHVNAEISGEITSVLDVDGIPGLAAFASHRGLQNPDFLIGLVADSGDRLLVPVDAKFSVETAKSKQVSAEMATALIQTEGSPVMPLLPEDGKLIDGFFISPDYELTHQMLAGAVGILRTAVHASQVWLLPAGPTGVFDREDVRDLAMDLAAIDRSRREYDQYLATALYYIRCGFSCVGAYSDEARPLLGRRDQEKPDLRTVRQHLEARVVDSYSAWTVVQQWDADAEAIRSIRIAVHQAAEVGIANRDLRKVVEVAAAKLGGPPPSINRVRRELAIWSTEQMVTTFGVIYHPVNELDELLNTLRTRAAELQAAVPEQVREIVTRALAD